MDKLDYNDIVRFWSIVDIGLKEHCWNYTAYKKNDGYGVFSAQKDGKPQQYIAHQVASYCFYGKKPKGMVTRHLCNNPSCCNPTHLQYGTHTENMHDMWIAGRGHRCIGEKAGRSVLSKGQVIKIVEIWKSGRSARGIAKEYGVQKSTILNIVNGRTWCHVTTALGIKQTRFPKFNEYIKKPSAHQLHAKPEKSESYPNTIAV